MSRTLLFKLTSRSAINAVNLLLVALLLQGVWEVFSKFGEVATLQHHMEEILEGLGTILVALGVALEERETLMKFLGLYPEGLTPDQADIDHHCHGYGLLLLLAGLFVEVAVYIVRMPNLNTVDFDPLLLGGGAVICLGGALLLARLTWLLWRVPAPSARAGA